MNDFKMDVHFGAAWNDLMQGVSSSAVYEFQGWARSVTYARVNGVYSITCAGVHTVYIRNDNLTRVLVGDVYKSGQIVASVDLKAGPVGIVLPLRGLAQTSFYCQMTPVSSQSILLHSPRFVPDAIEFPEAANVGLLATSVFALPVQNLQSHSLTLEYRVEKPIGLEGEYIVREVRHALLSEDSHHKSSAEETFHKSGSKFSSSSSFKSSDFSHNFPHQQAEETQTIVASGQTILLTLELSKSPTSSQSDSSSSILLPCRKKKPFTLTIIPSRGEAVKTLLDIQCRRSNQSFSISFVDHDHSVTQAVVILPYAFHSPQFIKYDEMHSSHFQSTGLGAKKKSQLKSKPNQQTSEAGIANSEECENTAGEYPVLLSLHGSGSHPTNHADSHKFMHPFKLKHDYSSYSVFSLISIWY